MNRKNLCKHVGTLIILGVFAFLAAGSLLDSPREKGEKAYKAGKYEKARKIWENLSDVTNPKYVWDAEACWYLGEICYQDGDIDKASEYKTKAWNYYAEKGEINKDLYSRIKNDPQMKEILAKQEKENREKAALEAGKQFVGTWSFYTVNKDGKSYSKSNLLRYPQKVVFKENGTGYVNTPTASGSDSHSDFTWSLVDGQLSTSLSGMKLAMNKSGYIVCRCNAIKNNMGFELVDIFFTKD